MSYGIILWGILDTVRIFLIQMSVRKINTDCGTRDFCRILIQKTNNSPFTSQYILSLLIVGVNNREQFLKNSEIHNINTRHSSNLHLHSAN